LLTDLEQMQEEAYRAWRRGSPLSRISYAQLQRNLALARANSDVASNNDIAGAGTLRIRP
jgi:epoxyqueuosine reductase QueG